MRNTLILVACLLLPLPFSLQAADVSKVPGWPGLPPGFGAEVNPTKQPIGGGACYTTGPNKLYGRAIPVVILKGNAHLPDDPHPTKDIWKVNIGENHFGGRP